MGLFVWFQFPCATDVKAGRTVDVSPRESGLGTRPPASEGLGLPRPLALENGVYCPLITSTGSPLLLAAENCGAQGVSQQRPDLLARLSRFALVVRPSVAVLVPRALGSVSSPQGRKSTKEMNYAYGSHFLDE